MMEYAQKKRRFRYVFLNRDTFPPTPTTRTRETDYYEYKAPDGTLYRSPDPSVLDRRRWRIEDLLPEDPEERQKFETEDRSNQKRGPPARDV